MGPIKKAVIGPILFNLYCIYITYQIDFSTRKTCTHYTKQIPKGNNKLGGLSTISICPMYYPVLYSVGLCLNCFNFRKNVKFILNDVFVNFQRLKANFYS